MGFSVDSWRFEGGGEAILWVVCCGVRLSVREGWIGFCKCFVKKMGGCWVFEDELGIALESWEFLDCSGLNWVAEDVCECVNGVEGCGEFKWV